MTNILEKKKNPVQPLSKLEWHSSYAAPAGWDTFVEKTTDCVYHGLAWTKTLEEGYHSKIFYLYGLENGELRIGIAGVSFDFLFFRLFFSLIPYGGFIGDFDYLPEFQTFLERRLEQSGFHEMRITRIARRPFPFLEGCREKRAFQHELDLSGKTLESLWKGYRKNNRRDISKAVRSGIKIVKGHTSEDLKDYYRLYDETMRRNRSLRFYPRPLYQSIQKNWLEQGKADIFFADLEGKKVAAILLIYGKDTTYLWGSVSSNKFLKFCPNDLLIHEAITETIKSGRRYFDFMMSEEKDAALIRFKEKWGAEAFPFLILEKDLSKTRAALWRILWKTANSSWGTKLIAFFENFKRLPGK